MTPRRPHIAVDARMVADGGIGTYLQNVLPRVARSRPEWRFTALGDSTRLRPIVAETSNVALAKTGARIYSVREQVELPLRCPRDADLYWAPHYNIPILLRKPLVVTVHDVCHLALPEGAGGAGGALRRLYAKALFGAVRRRAKGVLFDSEFSRSEMRRLVGNSEGRTAVSHLGVDQAWFRAGESGAPRPLREPYLVYVGNMKRHKNVPMLIRAYRQVQQRIPHRLVLIGRREGLRADPEIEKEMRGADDRVIFTDELGPELLRQYVTHSDGFVTASLYEGFGLPALEAMATGCPCVVSSAGSLPEICGDAALYCDPRNPESIAARILEIVTDDAVRVGLIERGHARARAYSWDRCADTTAALLESALP
jgi:glycosyltransferase involved in cell wall biosynthesis